MTYTVTCDPTEARSFAPRGTVVHAAYPEDTTVTGDDAGKWSVLLSPAGDDLCNDPLNARLVTVSVASIVVNKANQLVELVALPGPASADACTAAGKDTGRRLAASLEPEHVEALFAGAHSSYNVQVPFNMDLCHGHCYSERGVITAQGTAYADAEMPVGSEGDTHFCAFQYELPTVTVTASFNKAKGDSADVEVAYSAPLLGAPDLTRATIDFDCLHRLPASPATMSDLAVDRAAVIRAAGTEDVPQLGSEPVHVAASSTHAGRLATAVSRDSWLAYVHPDLGVDFYAPAVAFELPTLYASSTPEMAMPGTYGVRLACHMDDEAYFDYEVTVPAGAVPRVTTHLTCNRLTKMDLVPANAHGEFAFTAVVGGREFRTVTQVGTCEGSARAYVGPASCEFCPKSPPSFNAGGFGSSTCTPCPTKGSHYCVIDISGDYYVLKKHASHLAVIVCGSLAAAGFIIGLGAFALTRVRRRRCKEAGYLLVDENDYSSFSQ